MGWREQHHGSSVKSIMHGRRYWMESGVDVGKPTQLPDELPECWDRLFYDDLDSLSLPDEVDVNELTAFMVKGLLPAGITVEKVTEWLEQSEE